MHLSEFELLSSQLVEQRKRLRNLEEEIRRTELELKEQPRRSEKDRRFYALIGLDWSEPSQLKERVEELRRKRDEALRAAKEAEQRMLAGLSSGRFVVPLEPKPVKEGDLLCFYYRSGATYPRSIEGLAELLGVGQPIRLDDVTIAADRVSVREADPYFAKQKIVEAFEKIRKTALLKLSPRAERR
jgi:hypothetical protein